MAALIVQGKLPKPDIMAIVDTGREMPTTWEYLDQVTRPAMKKIGIDVHRVKAMKYANNWGHPSLGGWEKPARFSFRYIHLWQASRESCLASALTEA